MLARATFKEAWFQGICALPNSMLPYSWSGEVNPMVAPGGEPARKAVVAQQQIVH